jgi:transcriptional accessory protein Tex/SPT6
MPIKYISIGNGTTSKPNSLSENQHFDKPSTSHAVSEAGASVYSASKIAEIS